MSDDLTVNILIEIRDEIRSTNARLDGTNQRLDQARTELRAEIAQVSTDLGSAIAQVRTDLGSAIAQVRTDLGSAILGAELRIATRTIEQTAATRDLYGLLSGQLDLRGRVERCEHEIDALKQRVG